MKDRRIQRTKDALRRAMLSLVSEYGFEAISVQQIVDRANVGRSTFYSHFADKEELLEENIRELGLRLRQRMEEEPAEEVHPALCFSRPMLSHVGEMKSMFAALQRSRAVHELFFAMLCELIDEAIEEDDLSLPRQAVVAYVAAGFQAVARWWVREAPERSVEEIHQIYLRLVSPSLAASALVRKNP